MFVLNPLSVSSIQLNFLKSSQIFMPKFQQYSAEMFAGEEIIYDSLTPCSHTTNVVNVVK